MTIRTILDTDIGTDVDDCVALAVLLSSPEIELDGITCVYGDVQLRAWMVQKLLRLAGRTEIPVMLGAASTLVGTQSIYWEGHEGAGLLEPDDESLEPNPEHAVDFIVRTVMDNPGEIHLLAIGPLTNVALAFRREPRLASKLARLTLMGGVVRGPDRLDLPYVEHNMRCDPEAAHVVFAAGAPTTVVPLDVTTQVLVRADDVARIRAVGTPFHEAVARQVELYPRFARQGFTPLHDPLAAAVMVSPGLVEFVPARVEIETQGRLTSGMTLLKQPAPDAAATTQVAVAVESAAAEDFIRQRLTSPVTR